MNRILHALREEYMWLLVGIQDVFSHETGGYLGIEFVIHDCNKLLIKRLAT